MTPPTFPAETLLLPRALTEEETSQEFERPPGGPPLQGRSRLTRSKSEHPPRIATLHATWAQEKLPNKVALVTGGDSGIERAVAILFAREGADVAIVHFAEDPTDVKEFRETRTVQPKSTGRGRYA